MTRLRACSAVPAPVRVGGHVRRNLWQEGFRPRGAGWTVASAGGGTLIGRQILTFTASTLAAGSTVIYHVTLTTPAHARGRAVLAAATASVTRDPSYRNNAALALTQVR